MRQSKTKKWKLSGAILLLVGIFLLHCGESIRLSRGTRIPSEFRGLSSAEITEAFTRSSLDSDFSFVATLIDFSYVRAITKDHGRVRDIERETYHRYVHKQMTFYVHLMIQDRLVCRGVQSRFEESFSENTLLDMRNWEFELHATTGRDREPVEIEPGRTQPLLSGGCIVQGYVHFPGKITKQDHWIELYASMPDNRKMRSKVRWAIEHGSKPSTVSRDNSSKGASP